MRYDLIAYRQPILGCLFLFLGLLSCRPTDSAKKTTRLEAQSVLIQYSGDPSLEQGDFIQINGQLFWHDSLCIFHRNSKDTIYLPTQRYIADQPPGGRPVYSVANALSCMINMAEALNSLSDTTKYQVDVSRIYAGQLRINSKTSEPVEVIASKDYPLRVTAGKD